MKPQKLLRIALLINTPAVYAAVLNDTGIKTCSDADTNGLPCPVSGFPGQDAEYGTNSFNFTKLDANGNALPVTATNHSCVKDNVTGLIWEEKTNDGGLRDKDWTYTWFKTTGNIGTADGGTCKTIGRCDTEKFVQDVNTTKLCGYNDWRLPDPYELVNIVDYSINEPGPTISINYFTNTVSKYFWTSYHNNNEAWLVSFSVGGNSSESLSNRYAVRLVRGGSQRLVSYFDNGDGTVTDNYTGLMWAKCSYGQTLAGDSCSGGVSSKTWEQALAVTDSSTLAGYSDWRVPNVKELLSLVDYTTNNPAINSSYFPNTATYPDYWTASPRAGSSYYSWTVSFRYGYFDYGSRSYGRFIRLVRNALTAPAVSTDAPSLITANSATLKGTVNPNGAATSVTFNFGLTTTYGQSIAATPATVAATAAPTSVSATITGLTCGKTYHYRVKAVNSKGTTLGADKFFSTAACPPMDFVVTNAVLTPTTPVANGVFNANIVIKNQGAVSSDGGQLRVWTNQPTAQVCAATGGNKTIAVGTIAAGASKVLSVTGLTAGAVGTKKLRAFVDATCIKAEGNEVNNQWTKTYRVTSIQAADLVVTALTLNPATPSANGAFAVNVTVKNQGLLSGNGGFIDVWANQPTVPACGAEGNAWADVGLLAAGASKTLTLFLPSGVAGAKTARAFVDSWCEFAESNETNNQLTKKYSVQ